MTPTNGAVARDADAYDALRRAAPERQRSTARWGAGLTASGAGAVAAGLLFGPPTTTSTLGAVTAFFTLVALCSSVVMYAMAAQHRLSPASADESPEQYADRLADAIAAQSKRAGVAGIAALVLVVVTVALASSAPRSDFRARASLEAREVALVRAQCDGVDSDVEGTVPAEFESSSSKVWFTVLDESCVGGAVSVAVDVARVTVMSGRR